ncbi:MAG TPA: hypothetical protein VHG08_29220 [Longimicrobium sp.]|nr:hypothetical protein [Longimicrobium sp.]
MLRLTGRAASRPRALGTRLVPVLLLCLAMAPRPSIAQTAVGQLLLRPDTSHALLRSPGERQWRRVGQLAPVHRGDSVRLQQGSAELVFRSGARIPVPLGRAVAVSVPSEPSQGGILAYMGAAVEAILDLTRGNSSTRTLRSRALEAPVTRDRDAGGRRGEPLRQAVRVGAPDSASTLAHADAMPDRAAQLLRLPGNVGAWPAVPDQAGVRGWWLPGAALPAGVRIHVAHPSAGCPAAGPAIVDAVLADSASLQAILAGALGPGGEYRLEFLRPGGSRETLCVRVASREQEATMQAELGALRAEYGLREAEDADAALPMLEAALLARRGYQADALLRLQPLVLRPDAPETAVQLWRAIAAQGTAPPAPR